MLFFKKKKDSNRVLVHNLLTVVIIDYVADDYNGWLLKLVKLIE